MEATPDTIRILLTTDNHVGYLEKDAIRGSDSLKSFEEILKIATDENVDFILMGGDLFHENQPSRACLYDTMSLLRKYCLGDGNCAVEYLSDPFTNFNDDHINYQNPNINVKIPVFSIHGNHDDPTGEKQLCALNILSAAGLVNYFGKQSKLDDIDIYPVLLKKGKTMLALYGLGNIRDNRLHRTFASQKVRTLRPISDQEKWFNLMVLHQNRVNHGPKNSIPESFLDPFLDFVFWGHEHECLIDPVLNDEQRFYVSQPGSSVATSLCEGEAKPKHVGILSIKGREWKMENIKLNSVRPFVISDVELSLVDGLRPTDNAAIMEYLCQEVDILIEKAVDEWKQDHPTEIIENFPMPLIRLRVEYSGGYNVCNPSRFGQRFVSKVANPNDILHFYRKRVLVKKKIDTEPDLPDSARLPEILKGLKVTNIIEEYLGIQNLSILPENQLQDAVGLFADKDDKDAILSFIENTLHATRDHIDKEKVNLDDEKTLGAEVSKNKKVQFDEYAKNPIAKKVASKSTKSITSKSTKSKSKSVKKNDTSESEDAMEIDEVQIEPEEYKEIVKPPSKKKPLNQLVESEDEEPQRSILPKVTRRSAVQIIPSKRFIQESEDEDALDEDAVQESIQPVQKKTTTTRSRTTTAKPKKPAVTSKTSTSSKSKKPQSSQSKTSWIPARQSKLNFATPAQNDIPIISDDDDDPSNAFNSLSTIHKG